MTRLRQMQLRAKGYPIRVYTFGGKYGFRYQNSHYMGYDTLEQAIETIVKLVEAAYRWEQ